MADILFHCTNRFSRCQWRLAQLSDRSDRLIHVLHVRAAFCPSVMERPAVT